MNIFEFFLKLNHPYEKTGWIETTAVFTGRFEKAAVGKPGHYKTVDYNEYEVKYFTDNEERKGWYVFYPSPDPDPEDIKGTNLRIRYNRKNPGYSNPYRMEIEYRDRQHEYKESYR